MPAHTHVATGSSTPANLGDPTGNVWATGNAAYNPSPNTTMNPACVTPVGGSQAHLNMSPYLTINFCIALQGIYPSHP
jgi:microcystin-dependent protein